MFGRRRDGKKLKNIEPFQKIIPHIMKARHDSQNYFLAEVRCEPMDRFLRKMREEGISLSYLHIIICATVRLIAMRPQLNRFVMNGRIFKRHGIYISFVVKKRLSDDAVGTTVKLKFDGTEDIFQIKKQVDEAVAANSYRAAVNDTDKTAKFFTSMPNTFIKMAVGLVKWLDKHGMIPKKVLHASPFHTSCFITYMKSIKTDYIYHHLYDFGTTGIFLGVGKESYRPVVDPESKEVVAGKVMNVGIVLDERFCDGLYYANSFRLLTDFFKRPEQLCQPISDLPADVD